MSKTSKHYCRVTILMFLAISLVIPPVAVDAAVAPVVKKAQAALRANVSGAWTDESIDKVLMDLTDQTNVDIVKSPQVTGNVTAKVTDVPLSEALTNILAAHGFTYVATDNMIRVTALSEIALAKEELISKVYQITYADANEVAASLVKFVSDKGSVALNRGTSHIAVTDIESKMKAVDNFIAELDQQTDQVLVEVKIYEITTQEGFELDAAFRAARTQEYERVGASSPTTTKTTTTQGYDIVSENTVTELTPTTTTTTETPGYSVQTTDTRTEQSASSNGTITQTPGYQTSTVDTRSESPYASYEMTTRSPDTFVENVTSTHTGFDRTDTSVTTLPDIQTTSTTQNNGSFMREDTSTEVIPDVATTETTTVGGPFVRESTNREIVPDVKTTETTVVEQGSPGYLARKRNEPFVGGSFDRQRGGTLRFSLLDDAFDFEFVLSMLKKEVESKLLANPSILVVDNETANFEIVREIPYRELMQVARADPLSYTDFKNVGVQLKVTPHIARGGLVKLHIAPEFSILVGQNMDGTPTVDARRADTVALIRDGQTIAIGGLRKRESKIDIAKVPLLGDLPILKALFRSKTESEVINELVVLITPRIIKNSDTVPAELAEHGQNGVPKAFRSAGKPWYDSANGNGHSGNGNSGAHTPQVAEPSPEIMLQRAYENLKASRFELAAEMLNAVIARQADNGKAHQYLGYCQLKLGAVDKAIGSYLKAVELDGNDFEAHRGLGVAYMIKARSTDDSTLAAKAVEQWQTALDINPAQVNAAALRAMIEAYTQ